ncbi:sphingomyelin phosphodiesterase [Rhodotorula diobovata]|uniref:Sphingomyelin phosphodiesterase n=1 Tax=Rhodotorula diobovata TaxID=5288 RepID=A0A5C5FM94_9BASI|nr:sphingomyelin phosphodiesterase [Rhodotorula diobovata]
MKQLAEMGDEGFVDLATGFCESLGVQDADVCRGAVGTQAPILAHDLCSVGPSSLALNSFCATIFGLCPLPDTIPHIVNLTEPPLSPEAVQAAGLRGRGEAGGRRVAKQWVSNGRTPFQVVHITDTHVDREYAAGSDSQCSKVICCRNHGPLTVGEYAKAPAGPFGAERCDSPPALLESMFRAVDKYAANKSFTIFTGDAMDDAVWEAYQPKIEREMHSWHDELPSRSYPVFGNHDVAPVNGFPRSTTVNASEADWVFELAARDWEKWIGQDAAQQVRMMSGCYATVHPGTDLKIISLNTNYWYKQNCASPLLFWLYDSDKPVWDPNGILTWLARELDLAEQAGQRAWIIGHMSFGKTDSMRDQSNYANQIFQRYHNTIAAHFYGHSHRDEFEIGYSDYSNRLASTANAISYIAGALTPASGHPVFRIYDVDPDTYEIRDFTPVFGASRVEPEWTPYYSARESYGSMLDPPLSASEPLDGRFWHRVTEDFEADETAFQLFMSRMLRGHLSDTTKCDTPLCKARKICALRSMRSEDNCGVVPMEVSFKPKFERRSFHITGDQERDHDISECERPGLATMLRELADTPDMVGVRALSAAAQDAVERVQRRR